MILAVFTFVTCAGSPGNGGSTGNGDLPLDSDGDRLSDDEELNP